MTKDQVIQNLKNLSVKTSRPKLTLSDIRKIPKLEYYLYVYFENVAEALNEAGLEPSRLAKSYATSDDNLLHYLLDLGVRLKRKPNSRDINKDRKYEYHLFSRRFKHLGKNYLEKAYDLAKEKFGSVVVKVDTQELIAIAEDVKVKVSIPIKEFEYKSEYYGIAAENLAVSELLYRGYESYLINVDLGLDVMAQKNGKTYYFQVKNISFDNSNTRTIPITASSYIRNKSNNVYYFFIMQIEFMRNYIIIPQFKLQEWEQKNLIKTKEQEKINLTFVKKDEHFSIKFEASSELLDAYLNEKGWNYLI